MLGNCLWCGSEQNLTERLVQGKGCSTCGAPLEQALAQHLAESLAQVMVMSDNYGCNPIALRALASFSDLVS